MRRVRISSFRSAFSLGWLVASVVLASAGWLLLGSATRSAGSARYVEGVIGQSERVNPLFALPGTPDSDLVALVFNGLTRPAGDGTAVPDLAEAWDVTPDGRTYTFRLRGALFWHDGEPVTAGDVAFTIAKVQEPGFRGPPALAAEWAGVRVTARDARTIEVALPAPSSSFLNRASLGVLPEHLLRGVTAAELPDAAFNRAPVGTGPYHLRELTREAASLEANASYHPGVPGIGKVELRFYRDETALAGALERREVDGALLPEGVEGAASRAAAARADLVSLDLSSAGYTVLYLNNQRTPLDETRVRQGIAAAIDRAALLTEVFGGRGRAGFSPIVSGSWAAAEASGQRPRVDIDALFVGAGWVRGPDGVRVRDGERLHLRLETNADALRIRLAEAVAKQLRAAGVEAEIVTLPGVQLLQQRLQPRDYDMAIFGWDTGPDPDPYGAWHTSQIAAPGRNFAGFHDPATDALLEQARSTLDTGERIALYRQFEERFVEQAPSVILHYPSRVYVRPRWLGAPPSGLQFDASSRFTDVHRWRASTAG